MRFFSKPHIFTAKSNILDPQIILFDSPPRKPDQYQHDHNPKEPARKFVITATHAHGHFDLNLVRNTIAHANFLDFVDVLKLEQRVGHEYRVAFFAHIS